MKTCSLSLIVSSAQYIYAPFLSMVRMDKVIMKNKTITVKNSLKFFKTLSSVSYNMSYAQISTAM